jgi:hypothetical protein
MAGCVTIVLSWVCRLQWQSRPAPSAMTAANCWLHVARALCSATSTIPATAWRRYLPSRRVETVETSTCCTCAWFCSWLQSDSDLTNAHLLICRRLTRKILTTTSARKLDLQAWILCRFVWYSIGHSPAKSHGRDWVDQAPCSTVSCCGVVQLAQSPNSHVVLEICRNCPWNMYC